MHCIGDAHVYLNHVDALREQLTREPRPFPTLTISPEVTDPNPNPNPNPSPNLSPNPNPNLSDLRDQVVAVGLRLLLRGERPRAGQLAHARLGAG